MGRLTRAAALAAPLVLALAAGACGDDGGASSAAAPQSTVPSDVHGTTTPLDFGELDLEVPEGYQPIPLTSLGIGFGIPEGWQGTVLTDEAFERLEDIPRIDAFLAAARNAQASGAVFYAAGREEGGGIADLKLQVLPGDDFDRLVEAAAKAVPRVEEVERFPEASPPRASIRFSMRGREAAGTQWLFDAPEDTYSMIIINEDTEAHDELATTIGESVVFEP